MTLINETVTLIKHVTKYENMRKWMVEFLRNSESRGDEIVQVKIGKIRKILPVVIEGDFPRTVNL